MYQGDMDRANAVRHVCLGQLTFGWGQLERGNGSLELREIFGSFRGSGRLVGRRIGP